MIGILEGVPKPGPVTVAEELRPELDAARRQEEPYELHLSMEEVEEPQEEDDQLLGGPKRLRKPLKQL